MKTPTVTIGLPFHNAHHTLPRAVQSVFAQTAQDWELLLVDDGSTDGSREWAARLVDPRIRVLADGENRGLAARLNQIADAATGEYLFRMDADDIMFPERLARQLAFLRAGPGCDLLGTGVVAIDLEDRPRGERSAPESPVLPLAAFRGDLLYHPTVAGRRDWFRAHRYDPAFRRSQDFELWTRCAGEATIRNLPEPLLFYREFGSASWGRYRQHSLLARQIIAQHGPGQIGAAACRRMIARRRAKDVVYLTLHCFGLWTLALRLRNRNLSSERMLAYEGMLDRVKATPLPFSPVANDP